MSGGGHNGAEPRHPRDTTALFGHHEAEAALLDSYRGGRMPHAFLIGGPRGVGKATLAYRMARFVLAHDDPALPAVRAATSLAVDPDHPAARRVAQDTHGGLLVLERRPDDKGNMRASIVVNQVRETVPFFGSTATSGWRVCIVDCVDELQSPAAPNALLKILEEPPPRALFLLVSHAPGRVLATIQSRCRKLMLRALDDGDVIRAAAASLDMPGDSPDLIAAARAGEGSVARAITFLGVDSRALHGRITALLDALPAVDPLAMHALGEALGGSDRAPLMLFADTVDQWLARRLGVPDANARLARLAQVAEVWEKVSRAIRDAETWNLERKPLVFSVFGLLADVARP
ncbi:MAG: DNA polymerase III subunit delta' [Xanthobacteraceae bacterium]|nr:MAG: DNA polymerase III subunit delta' [Xanthobacteraceae bacterium]